MGGQGRFSFISNQYDFTVILMTMKTTTNTGKKTKKIQKRNARNFRSHLNTEIFAENFIYDSLNDVFKPMGAFKIRIM